MPVDAGNAVGRTRAHSVGLTVRAHGGMIDPRDVSLKVEASYDDGRTWCTARITRRVHGSCFATVVELPAHLHRDSFVTLRVTAADASGNSVRVTRAYLHRGTT